MASGGTGIYEYEKDPETGQVSHHWNPNYIEDSYIGHDGGGPNSFSSSFFWNRGVDPGYGGGLIGYRGMENDNGIRDDWYNANQQSMGDQYGWNPDGTPRTQSYEDEAGQAFGQDGGWLNFLQSLISGYGRGGVLGAAAQGVKGAYNAADPMSFDQYMGSLFGGQYGGDQEWYQQMFGGNPNGDWGADSWDDGQGNGSQHFPRPGEELPTDPTGGPTDGGGGTGGGTGGGVESNVTWPTGGYDYSPPGFDFSLTGPQMNDEQNSVAGGNMAGSTQTAPMQGGYNPFAVENLFGPMNQRIDDQTEQQIAQLTEKSGMGGGRWSSALAQAQAQALRGAANDKNSLTSNLMYQDAQNNFQRQQQAAQMAMQLGGMSSDRDLALAQQLQGLGGMQDQRDRGLQMDFWNMGGQERGMSNEDLAAYYNQWNTENYGMLDKILGMLGGYNPSIVDTRKPKSNPSDNYGAYANLLAQIIGAF